MKTIIEIINDEDLDIAQHIHEVAVIRKFINEQSEKLGNIHHDKEVVKMVNDANRERAVEMFPDASAEEIEKITVYGMENAIAVACILMEANKCAFQGVYKEFELKCDGYSRIKEIMDVASKGPDFEFRLKK